jgi:hypothetical protein
MGATEFQSNWPEMRKTLEKPGFYCVSFRITAERTGTELLGVFPMFLKSSKGAWKWTDERADIFGRTPFRGELDCSVAD